MAHKKHNEIAVGITFLAVLGLTIYIVIALSNPSEWFAKTKHIRVHLPYTEGLKGLSTGSPIMLGGVRIGQIVQAGLDKATLHSQNNVTGEASCDKPDVYFIMEIPENIRIYSNCQLAAQSNIMGGQANLVIKDLIGKSSTGKDSNPTGKPGKANKLLADNADIKTSLEGGITEVIDKFKKELDTELPGTMMFKLKDTITKIQTQLSVEEQTSLMSKIHEVIGHLSQISTRLNSQLDTENSKAMIAKINVAIDTLNATLAHIDEMVSTNSPAITSTISSLKDTALSLKSTAGQIKKATPDIIDNIKVSLKKTEKAIDTARVSLDNLKIITADIKNMIKADRETIDHIVNNLDEVSINLKAVSRDVKRAPWKLLYKPSKRELDIQGLVDSAGDFAAGAEQLDNVSLRLKAILSQAKGSIADNKQIQNIMAELKTSFQHFKKAEDRFWQQLDKK